MLQAWSQETKTEEVVGGDGKGLDGWDGAVSGGYEPTQANTRHTWLTRREAGGAYEIDAEGVGTGKAVGSGAVGFGDRLREAGKEIGVAVVGVFAVFQGVRVCRVELEPAPDASVVFADLGDALERFVVRVDVGFSGPKVAAQPFHCPDDAPGLEVEGHPRTFRV